MKPGFALSLSFDGITLLHRSAAGWRAVGDADPRSPALADELAALRRSATALSPGGFQCKLIIPNDQIRYMTLETGPLDENGRLQATRQALEGVTPYAVSELFFDVEAAGSDTRVAAVARDTLREAEIFAVEHQLNPVSFAAWPEKDGCFEREPFFGETEIARTLLPDAETVEREDIPLRSKQTGFAECAQDLSTSTAEDVAGPDLNQATDPPLDTDPESDTAPKKDPNFVSRRRVPTFRTDPSEPLAVAGATAGSVPGFGEPPAPFEKTPKPKTRRAPDASVLPAPSPVVRKTQSDEERFTIYGARSTEATAGRSRGMGGLLLVGLVLVSGIAAFASGAIGTQVSAFFDRLSTPAPVAQFTAPLQPQVADLERATSDRSLEVDLVALDVSLSDEDAAVLDAMRAPLMTEPEPASLPQTDEVRAAYAASGIWHVAPDVPTPPPLTDLEGLYVTRVDPVSQNFDAVALPDLQTLSRDSAFLGLPSPAPAGTTFTFDERGLVIATVSGSLTPDGVLVFAGAPPVRTPATMVKVVVPSADLSEQLRLAAFRPKARPSLSTAVSAPANGVLRPELGAIRPRMRPQTAQDSAQQTAQAAALASASLASLDDSDSRALLAEPEGTNFTAATANAIVASLRPEARPSNLGARAETTRETASASASTALVTRVAPKAVTPKIPSSASVAREATTRNALNLRKVNLIGVYGKPASRRALVRLSNGRYVKVKVGDRIDGGRISDIGDAELRYQKSGRDVVLTMPRG